MTDTTRCPRCGGDLSATFSPGICPTCLMQQGLSPSTINSAAGAMHSGSGRRRSWTPPTPTELAPRFPQLEIVELLGQGGMGAVYKVRQRDLDRWAALKVLSDEVAHDPDFAERFQREARALALLGHQHIVIVYEFGQRDGVYFLLMEYIDGVTLRQAIRAGHISSKDALSIVMQICDALQFAHEEGVVHRDIKPENILIDKRGRVKIADFGLAKLLGGSVDVRTLTGTHQVMGTPAYMAPEQMEGTRGVDHRADIFSLGVVFYELLTGELPLGRFAPPSQKYQLDVRLDEVVLRTLEKEPDRRYQQASDVRSDVESIRSQPLTTMPVVSRKGGLWTFQQRQKAGAADGTPRQKRISSIMVFGAVGLCTVLALCLISLIDYFENYFERSTVLQREANRQSRLHLPHGTKTAEMSPGKRAAQEANWSLPPGAHPQPQAEATDPDAIEDRAIVQFVAGVPKLNANFGTDQLTPEERVRINEILVKIHNDYLAVELLHTKRAIQGDGTLTILIEGFGDEISTLENDLWTLIDSELSVSQQRYLRLNLPLFADPSRQLPLVGTNALNGAGRDVGFGGMGDSVPMGMEGGSAELSSVSRLEYEQLLGWKQYNPILISIARRGKWYKWSISNGAPRASGETPELPRSLRRFWKTDAPITPKPSSTPGTAVDKEPRAELPVPVSPTDITGVGDEPDSQGPVTTVPPVKPPSLQDEPGFLDDLPANDQTRRDEVERRANGVLEGASPADKGRIHRKLAQLYGQSDIRGHADDVTRHAREGLKYERDPIERGRLYMYLGNAAEARNSDPKTFSERRAEATRWYLKGYAELLPYDLPATAPELPDVEKTAGDSHSETAAEISSDQLAAQVRHTAQLKVRKDAEFTRELIQLRGIYLARLKELFGSLHDLYDDSGETAEDRLFPLAVEVLPPNPKTRLLRPMVVDTLIRQLWPDREPSGR
jgi:serine/threonine protein kinase